ncbi:MAG TPA: transcription antiterminator BglG [Ruminococcaceae bacterium]|nr:transcription antiterminator BglG [Oscillospiraceae bacterium]
MISPGNNINFKIQKEAIAMKIIKIINNNVVYARDKGNEHVIVMGKGTGFSGSKGDLIPEEKIEKIIRMDNESSLRKLKEQIEELPEEHFKISTDIVEYASQHLEKQLNKNVLITLTDHISFAIQRYQNGIIFPNKLLWEIKSFYPKEFEIGEYAVNLIKQSLQIEFSSDEAAFIAMHITCAEYYSDMHQMMDTTKFVSGAIKIVTDYFNIHLNETSLRFERFVAHLRYLARCIFENSQWENEDDNDNHFSDTVSLMFPKDYECSLKISAFIEKEYGHKMSDMEISYLAIHIKNLRSGGLEITKSKL